jgi:hypothetical protein
MVNPNKKLIGFSALTLLTSEGAQICRESMCQSEQTPLHDLTYYSIDTEMSLLDS